MVLVNGQWSMVLIGGSGRWPMTDNGYFEVTMFAERTLRSHSEHN